MTQCEYLRKLCKTGCDNYQCRAFFPENQPLVLKRDLPMCMSDAHKECVRYIEGRQYHEERLRKKLESQCPYASNTICGKPWDWWCKGAVPPFELTIPKLDEKGLPLKDEAGNIIFERSYEDIKETCLSGDSAIYMECPHYKTGEEFKKIWLERKKKTMENKQREG